jgi:hypothetical protein
MSCPRHFRGSVTNPENRRHNGTTADSNRSPHSQRKRTKKKCNAGGEGYLSRTVCEHLMRRSSMWVNLLRRAILSQYEFCKDSLQAIFDVLAASKTSIGRVVERRYPRRFRRLLRPLFTAFRARAAQHVRPRRAGDYRSPARSITRCDRRT